MVDRSPRTLLEQRIRQQCMTFGEFVKHAEAFARDNHEPGTLSVRYLQRLISGGQPIGSLRPGTARLLERLFSEPIAALLARGERLCLPAKNDVRDATDLCDLLRMGQLPEAYIDALHSIGVVENRVSAIDAIS